MPPTTTFFGPVEQAPEPDPTGSGSANESGGADAVQGLAHVSGAGLGWQGMTLLPGLLLEADPGFWLFLLTLCRVVSEVFGIISNVRALSSLLLYMC